MTSPKISVVIPTINRHEILDQTVASLLDQTCTGQEIIVVDQSESAADCTSGPLSDPRVRYFRVSRRGSPRGRNYGIARARAEIVFSGDDDIIASPQLLQAHLDCYGDLEVGGVAGRVLTSEDRPLGPISQVGGVNWCTGKMVANFHATQRQRVWHVQGSNCSFRASALRQVGGFDKAFTGIGHFEEPDLAFRVVRAGWKLVFEPRAESQHLQFDGGGNRPRSFHERTFWHFHNYAVLYRRHFRQCCLPLFCACQVARAVGYAVRERDPALACTALGALWRGFTRPTPW